LAMSSKQIKKLRKKIKQLQVEWLQSILPENQAATITVENVQDLMPDQTHVNSYGQLRLSFMSDKWIMKILKDNEGVDTYKDLQEINRQQQERHLDRRI
jgi:uncharacterized membrane protein YkoI